MTYKEKITRYAAVNCKRIARLDAYTQDSYPATWRRASNENLYNRTRLAQMRWAIFQIAAHKARVSA